MKGILSHTVTDRGTNCIDLTVGFPNSKIKTSVTRPRDPKTPSLSIVEGRGPRGTTSPYQDSNSDRT